MGYDITKFDFKADLASAAFNAKFQEVETYLNNISSEIQTLRKENKTLKEKNEKLEEKLNNKAEKTDGSLFKKMKSVSSENVDILEYAKGLKSSGYFQLYFNNVNTPEGNWDWAFVEMWYMNETTIRLQINKILPPYQSAKNNLINGKWQGWTVV